MSLRVIGENREALKYFFRLVGFYALAVLVGTGVGAALLKMAEVFLSSPPR